MEVQIQTIEAMQVMGIATRTTNQNEMHPATAKIPALWGRLFQEQVMDKVPGRTLNAFPVGVYSQYDSDHRGPYSVLVGAEVLDLDTVPDGMVGLAIPAGRYLVFTAQGPMPQVVIDTWIAIWQYFSENPQYTRAYSTDVELYRGPEEVAIHIAIK